MRPAVNPQYHYRAARDVRRTGAIRESGAAMDREENELGVSCMLFRCLIFMGGCRTPCRFRFDITSETGGGEKSPETTA